MPSNGSSSCNTMYVTISLRFLTQLIHPNSSNWGILPPPPMRKSRKYWSLWLQTTRR